MGPYCTQIMADLGADVIKLENPDGDTSRYVGPSRTKGRAGMFINLNRGKRGIVLALRQQKGCELCLKLAAKSDVEIGRAHLWTQVTHAKRRLQPPLEKKK